MAERLHSSEALSVLTTLLHLSKYSLGCVCSRKDLKAYATYSHAYGIQQAHAGTGQAQGNQSFSSQNCPAWWKGQLIQLPFSHPQIHLVTICPSHSIRQLKLKRLVFVFVENVMIFQVNSRNFIKPWDLLKRPNCLDLIKLVYAELDVCFILFYYHKT